MGLGEQKKKQEVNSKENAIINDKGIEKVAWIWECLSLARRLI